MLEQVIIIVGVIASVFVSAKVLPVVKKNLVSVLKAPKQRPYSTLLIACLLYLSSDEIVQAWPLEYRDQSGDDLGRQFEKFLHCDYFLCEQDLVVFVSIIKKIFNFLVIQTI
jgi:hypothetical protein